MMELLRKKIVVIMFLLPVCLYFVFVGILTSNIPYLDDYPAILGFITAYLKTGSHGERIQLIFAQHNDHRIVFQRLIVLAQYYLCGSINFKYLIFLGNLSIVGILIILWKSVNTTSERLFHMLPVVCLLFSFRYYQASLWAMVTLSGLWVITFSLASLWLLSLDGIRYFLGSCFFALLAMYTQGNGKLVLLSGFILLLIKKNYKQLFLWIGFSSALCLSSLLFKFTYSGYSNVLTVLKSPMNNIVSVFSFLGLFAGDLRLSVFLGIIVVFGFIHCCCKKYYQQNLTLFMIYFHLVVTAAAVGYARPVMHFTARYAIYSVLALIVIYLAYSEMYSSRIVTKYYVTCVSIFFVCSLFLNYAMAPFYISLYNSRVKNYEKNVVLSYNGKIMRQEANRLYRKEFMEIISSNRPFFIPEQVIILLQPRFERSNQAASTEEHWWLKWIPFFSEDLVTADRLRIYSINEMLDEKKNSLVQNKNDVSP